MNAQRTDLIGSRAKLEIGGETFGCASCGAELPPVTAGHVSDFCPKCEPVETVASPLPVAHKILEQLGGNRFLAMTGARDLVGGDRMLQFRLPRGAKDGINSVRITLDQNDTYTVKFIRAGRTTHTVLATRHGVYADNLCAIFEHNTDLKVSL